MHQLSMTIKSAELLQGGVREALVSIRGPKSGKSDAWEKFESTTKGVVLFRKSRGLLSVASRLRRPQC